jgi:hypothetical protein
VSLHGTGGAIPRLNTRTRSHQGRKIPAGRAERQVSGHFLHTTKAGSRLLGPCKVWRISDPGGGTGTVANFNSKFYSKVFELILRLKGNYLWPAMWNNAFAEDDPDNPRLADEYGIVMGTSHQEPMMRAQKEWDWHFQKQYGNWNFATQEETMTKFWRDGVEERKNFENIYTVGLRGENDTAMVQGQAENISLLQHIVECQRKISRMSSIQMSRPCPRCGPCNKEVQGYYEKACACRMM